MKHFSLFLSLLLGFSLQAQINYSTYGKRSHGNYTYTSVTGDPTQSRWYVLPNGMTVILAVNKDMPRIQTMVATKAGSKNDPADNTGLAHYLEHMLFKGTDKYGTQDYAKEKVYLDQIDALYEQYNKTQDPSQRKSIYRQIDSVSGLASKFSIANEFDKMCQGIGAQGTNAFTSVEQTVYINDIPSNRMHQWIEIESERYRNPVLRLFHTELEAVYEEKNISLDNDGEESYEKIMASLFKAHPYGTQTTIGTVEHLKNPSLIKIRNYFNTYYVPNNMAVIMVGDFVPEEAIEMIDKHFSYMQAKPVPPFSFQIEYPRGRPDSLSVVGPDAANVMLGWRFEGASSRQAILLRIVDLLLNNSKAGLIDLNLVKEQKVLSANSSPEIMKDYSVHFLTGKPKEGQTLEEVKDLLLAQIEKIKKGQFDEQLLKGIIANAMVEDIQKYAENQGVAFDLLDAFVTDRAWKDVLNINYEMSLVKKQEIIDFVNEFYTNGYSVVYKRTGEDTKQNKIEKPSITEVELNRDKSSQFVMDILEEEVDSIHPVYVDFNKDIQKGKIGNADFIYKKNEKNQLFSLYYMVDMGKNNNKKLPLALEYLQYLGTDKLSANELSMKFYQLACNFSINAGETKSYVTLTGPQQNFNEALALFEELLQTAKADNKALKDYVGRILKSREDAKLNKRMVSSALSTYAIYGPVNPRTYILSNEELKALTASDLVSMIKGFSNYKHQILYYGPQDQTAVSADIAKYHKQASQFTASPKAVEFKPIQYAKNTVYFTHFDMVQAEINWRSGASAFDINRWPIASAYNEYFGGGMSSVVFQEIRESRALAYSTYSVYSTAEEKNKNDIALAYVGTQADKLNDAIKAMNELLTNMPENEESFNQAKQSLLSGIESERIIKESVLFSYIEAQELGLQNDYRSMMYETIKTITFDQVKAFQSQNIKGRQWGIAVVGSKEKIKESDLKQYGEFKTVTLKEIFGY